MSKLFHTDGGWSNGIRSLFIYGTGALHISLLKGNSQKQEPGTSSNVWSPFFCTPP